MLARRAVFAGVTITVLLFPTFACAIPAHAEVLVSEDFEDDNLSARGWYDIARWGEDESLSIAGEPEVLANTGKRCLKIRYAEGGTGGWMHIRLKEAPEVYVRYYRLFPEGWEWPKGYGPHDSLVIATEYVGTLEQHGNQPPRAWFSQTRDWGSMTAKFDARRSADPDGEIKAFEFESPDAFLD